MLQEKFRNVTAAAVFAEGNCVARKLMAGLVRPYPKPETTTRAAASHHGPISRTEKPSKNAAKPMALTLEKPKRGSIQPVKITPRKLPKYWVAKKKPDCASVSAQWREKNGRIGPNTGVITPIRIKLKCSSGHSARAFGKAAGRFEISMENGVSHKMHIGTSARRPQGRVFQFSFH